MDVPPGTSIADRGTETGLIMGLDINAVLFLIGIDLYRRESIFWNRRSFRPVKKQ